MNHLKWSLIGLPIAGLFLLGFIFLKWIHYEKVNDYTAANDSIGGLNELFRDMSGDAAEERDDIAFIDGISIIFLGFFIITAIPSVLGSIAWAVYRLDKLNPSTSSSSAFSSSVVSPPTESSIPGSGFRLDPPKEWTVDLIDGNALPVYLGPAVHGIRSSINFAFNTQQGIQELHAEITTEMKQLLQDYRELRYTDSFATDHQRIGTRFVVQGIHEGISLHYTIFIFSRVNGPRLCIYCVTNASHSMVFEPWYDQCVRKLIIY